MSQVTKITELRSRAKYSLWWTLTGADAKLVKKLGIKNRGEPMYQSQLAELQIRRMQQDLWWKMMSPPCREFLKDLIQDSKMFNRNRRIDLELGRIRIFLF
ncbi:hypothetical protein COT97_00005 [Candidatus Falkowbacteria bacterium CG10_big_fil_rev_8_21_14_0_10_39_11]|uniref:Uncharacterized protein n=1 Tax=Candidatus Falkowbacteria bacterium CG10_big_fil_rev_8_21_14_0_10_39_11 TaxID=1974565 RepID=A0A2H0V6E0_9BACT|nr:MAG: hypothetical protein COT97_00005 [Candidatus Falkowbacteria bacterium CG10_big_fil_rev_8_21_14_0_10_39_11]